MNEPCAQCRIEIAAGERTEPDPDCFACGGVRWINSRTGERVIANAARESLAEWEERQRIALLDAMREQATDDMLNGD